KMEAVVDLGPVLDGLHEACGRDDRPACGVGAERGRTRVPDPRTMNGGESLGDDDDRARPGTRLARGLRGIPAEGRKEKEGEPTRHGGKILPGLLRNLTKRAVIAMRPPPAG